MSVTRPNWAVHIPHLAVGFRAYGLSIDLLWTIMQPSVNLNVHLTKSTLLLLETVIQVVYIASMLYKFRKYALKHDATKAAVFETFPLNKTVHDCITICVVFVAL